MTIARTLSISIAVMFALAIGIAAFDPVYADSVTTPKTTMRSTTKAAKLSVFSLASAA
jgi:hypothetical protein